jgi:hypothetical protein
MTHFVQNLIFLVYVLGNMRKRKMEETTKDPFLVIMKKMKILIERRRIRNINNL